MYDIMNDITNTKKRPGAPDGYREKPPRRLEPWYVSGSHLCVFWLHCIEISRSDDRYSATDAASVAAKTNERCPKARYM
jgi:hypothetical protein